MFHKYKYSPTPPLPNNVGILAMDIYIPTAYVSQEKLEKFDKLSTPGKYTTGLGQTNMGFCTDREDIHSICLTVVDSLMTKYNVPYECIGRLEVGTETIIDKSKSVKSFLMQLFAEKGCHDIDGIDMKNACYAGTAALFNATSWIESSQWDGRLALVVAGDIAVYASGPARATGGSGAIAMLIGPDASLVIESNLKSVFMDHTFDFYKPNLSSEYPIVDGPATLKSYQTALVHCYLGYKTKTKQRLCKHITYRDFSYILFHAPFVKQVQKAYAKIYYLDHYQCNEHVNIENLSKIDKEKERDLMQESHDGYMSQTFPSLFISTNVGNMYCASLYAGLISVICNHNERSNNGRIGMFSYGSGLASCFFSIRIKGSLDHIRDNISLLSIFNKRIEIDPKEFESIMIQRESSHKPDYIPTGSLDLIQSNVYYLDHIDSQWRRYYIKKAF